MIKFILISNRSFALYNNAKKAIMRRGWGPLSYILLDHKDLIHAKSNTVATIASLTSTETDLQSLNTSGKIFGTHLDNLISKKLRNEAAKTKYLYEKKERE